MTWFTNDEKEYLKIHYGIVILLLITAILIFVAGLVTKMVSLSEFPWLFGVFILIIILIIPFLLIIMERTIWR